VEVAVLVAGQVHLGLLAAVVVNQLRQAVQAFQDKDLQEGLVQHQLNQAVVAGAVQVLLA
jgi:hypothetical protein